MGRPSENRRAYQDRFARQRQTDGFQKHKREHDPRAILVDQLLHDGTAMQGISDAPLLIGQLSRGGALNVMYK